MIRFEIEEIDNGFLVKGDLGWLEDSHGDYIDDFTLFAHSIEDALAMLATKCDQIMDEQISVKVRKPPEEDQDSLF